MTTQIITDAYTCGDLPAIARRYDRADADLREALDELAEVISEEIDETGMPRRHMLSIERMERAERAVLEVA